MKWFILLVGVVVLCFAVALVLGWIGGQGGMGAPSSSLRHERLPDGELHDADLDELVFDVGLRGYRMSQVDGVVERLRRELREKDAQIAVLRGDLATFRPEAAAEAAPEAARDPDSDRASDDAKA